MEDDDWQQLPLRLELIANSIESAKELSDEQHRLLSWFRREFNTPTRVASQHLSRQPDKAQDSQREKQHRQPSQKAQNVTHSVVSEKDCLL